MAVIIVTCSKCGARMHNRRTNWHKSGEYATCYYLHQCGLQPDLCVELLP